jgi:hypothetical protein
MKDPNYYLIHVRDMLAEYAEKGVEPSPEDCGRWAELLSRYLLSNSSLSKD